MKELIQAILIASLGIALIVITSKILAGDYGETVERIFDILIYVIMVVIFFFGGGEKTPSENK